MLNYLFWECTTRCNLNCLHCGSDCSSNSCNKDMPLEHFLSAIDTITVRPSHFTIVLTGGEPLLRKDIERCGKEIRKRGFKWSMVTNGYLYSKEKHNLLLNAGLGALTISLDGMEENHNWLRNNPNSYCKAITAIEIAATSTRLFFDVVTCVNNRNINELENIYQLLLSKKVKNWRLFTIAPIGRAKINNELNLTHSQLKQLLTFISTKRKTSQMDVKFSCEGYVGNFEGKVRDGNFFCRAGINIGSILIDGAISACPNIDRNFTQGNIYSHNFNEIWQTEFKIFRDRKWLKTGKCTACKSFNSCNGNGFHYRQFNSPNVMVCHNEMITLTN